MMILMIAIAAASVTFGQTKMAKDSKAVSGCEVKSYSLDNLKFVMLNKDSALVTYTAMQDTVCNGKTFPNKSNSSAVYVMRGGKWLSAMHMETAATN